MTLGSSVYAKNIIIASNVGIGGFNIQNSIAVIDSSSIENNYALNSNGSAIYLNTGNVLITNSVISNNRASYGGAFYVSGPNSILNISNTFMVNNTAKNIGGGLYCDNGTVGTEILSLKQNSESYCGPNCSTSYCNLTQLVSSSLQVFPTGNKDNTLTTIIASSVSASVGVIAGISGVIYCFGFSRLCFCFKRKAPTNKPVSGVFLSRCTTSY